jgi:hypothetical protein
MYLALLLIYQYSTCVRLTICVQLTHANRAYTTQDVDNGGGTAYGIFYSTPCKQVECLRLITLRLEKLSCFVDSADVA